MDNIIEPNNLFDFSKISLAHPVGIQGGAYFTKIEINNKPLYIQTSKSLSKQGFVKTGKKYYCDLLFDKNSEELINWFENLEVKCHKLIFEKKDIWFQGNLEENDIETAFNPLIRIYKSGKYYLLRTNVKNTKDDIPAVKIYDENQLILGISDITLETEFISILEIQGIKFTSRNFQIEIEIKQIMVLNNNPIFDNCLIKSNKKSLENPLEKPLEINKNIETIISNSDHLVVDNNLLSSKTSSIINEKENKSNSLETLKDLEEIDLLNLLPLEEPIKELNKSPFEDDDEKDVDDEEDNEEQEVDEEDNEEEVDDFEEIDDVEEVNDEVDIQFEDLNNDLGKDIQQNDKLKEIDDVELNLEKNVETIKLKKPNQVYFELYKEARNKAKLAKKNAILAYLEAKNIKKTYMIENINDSDSDSDFDAEIDEVSESELENL